MQLSLCRCSVHFPYFVPYAYKACFESVFRVYSVSLSSLVLGGFRYVSGIAPVCATTGAVAPERVGFPASISSWSETLVVPPLLHAHT